jgi:hypothetical protein
VPVDKAATEEALLDGLLGAIVSHFGASWSAAAYLGSGAEAKLAAWRGTHTFSLQPPAPPAGRAAWLDASTLQTALKGAQPLGQIVFRNEKPVSNDEQDELEQTFLTIADSIARSLEQRAASPKA